VLTLHTNWPRSSSPLWNFMAHVTRCILHFGMPKTGSTSIQESLYSGLTDPDFYYPDLGHPNHGMFLFGAFSEKPELYHANHKLGIDREQLLSERPAVLQRLADEISRCGPRTMVLSAEELFSFGRSEAAALLAFFLNQGRHLQLVAYVRPIRGWMESRFTQALVEPGLTLPKEMFAWVANSKTWCRHIQSKDDVFGRDRVTLWPFLPAHFPQGCVVQDFCRRIGMKRPPEVIHRSNERLALPAIRLLYAYRTLGPGYGIGPSVMNENANLLRHLEKLTEPRFHFHSEWLDDYCRRNETDIAWIESRLGASLRDGIGEDKDDHAIRVESDLLAFSPESLEWLAERTGTSFRKLTHGDPSDVAATVHRLRFIPVDAEARAHSTISSLSFAGKIRQRAHSMLSWARRKLR